MRSPRRPSPFVCFVAISALSLLAAGCSDDGESDPDVGVDVADTTDGDGDAAIVECPDDPPPLDGDLCDCEGDDFEGRVGLCDRTCLCEFGFWSCTEECDDPETLSIELGEDPTVDEQTGNGDTSVNPGETWSVSGTVRAVSAPEGGVDTTIRLLSDSIHADVAGATTTADGLDETPVTFTLPFEIGEAAPASTITLTLEAFSGFVTTSVEIDVEIEALQVPLLEFGGVEVVDESGGSVARVDGGDTIRVRGSVSNTGVVAAEGVEVSASSSSTTLAITGDATLGVIAPDGSSTFEFTAIVADDPIEFDPVVTLAATADNATTVTDTVSVTVVPPEVLHLVGHAWEAGGGADEYTLVIEFRNDGTFPLTGLEWTRTNYQSFVPDPPPDPPQCPGEEECPEGTACHETGSCVEDPFFESMELGAASGPAMLAAGASGDVEMALTVTGTTPEGGKVIVRATSDARSHGPFTIDVTRPE